MTVAAQEQRAVWDRPLAEVLRELGASRDGLSAAEAERRLARYGPNVIARARRASLLREALSFLLNPLVLILLLASGVSAFLGEPVNALLITLIVLVSMALNFAQTYRSQRAVERLQAQVAMTAAVCRDGRWAELPVRELVPGDVIRLAAGDLVPADARLLEARDLHVVEAPLTGESLPVEKAAAELEGGPRSLAEARNTVFLGTSVLSGTATAVVVATGARTSFGAIAERLAVRPPPTEFEQGLRQFGLLITRMVLFLVLFVFLVNSLLHRDPLESFLFAVALAVGLTPEFLPMIMSVTLARGAGRMAERHVIVKRLEAIENFGSMDVLCSDKTGTLTRGEVELAECVDLDGQPSARVLLLTALNSGFESGIKSPLDAAVLRHSHPALEEYRKLDELPFDFQRRRLSVVVARGGERLLVTKGAPESVLAVCRAYTAADGTAAALDEAARARIEATLTRLSQQGYHLLGVASRPVDERPAYSVADEQELTFAGFAAFADPPREDASRTIAMLARDGIRVKILTGDSELVARAICSRVGMEIGRILTGAEIDRLSDSALAVVADETTLFARVSPEQKNRVLHALRRRGHVVGFLGDGINDAPSLHAADIGISVANATDVAKDAADIILLDASLGVLHEGVLEGRRSFGNIMKYILMGTSSNFGNMFSMAGASLFLPFLPLLPFQVLLNNFLYDAAQAAIPGDQVDPAFVRKPRRWNIRFIRDFMLVMGPVSSLFDFLTFFVMLRLFQAPPSLFRTGWFVESLATQALVIFVIRTSDNPLTSRPSRGLLTMVLGAVVTAALLPYSPAAPWLQFQPLPPIFFLVLASIVVLYLALVEVIKRWFYRLHGYV